MKVNFFMNNNWNYLLSEFCRLGGIAENLYQKDGANGRGIFPVNPSLKSRIFTPTKLMIKIDHVYLENNKLRIKKDEKYTEEFRNFFNFYQDNFSWGAGGRETTESFEQGLLLFNSNLKHLIKKYALVDLRKRHEGNWDNVIKKQFLNARGIKVGNNIVIAPIWELVNHNVRSLPFILNKNGISTPNYSSSSKEIRFSYSNISPLKRFFNYGFFSEESIIYSIPFSLNIKNLNINISCKGKDLNNDSMKIERFGQNIILEGLPIADVNHPKLPYHYFNEIFRKIGLPNISQDLLLKIFKLNISIRNEILKESQLTNNEVSDILVKLIKYEISLINSNN